MCPDMTIYEPTCRVMLVMKVDNEKDEKEHEINWCGWCDSFSASSRVDGPHATVNIESVSVTGAISIIYR